MHRNRDHRAIGLLVAILMTASIALVAVAASDEAGDAPTSDIQEHLDHLNQMCETTAEARSARQAETPLYDRLGGYDKISALTTEIVKLH